MRVVQVRPGPNYKLLLVFEDNSQRIFDVSSHLWGEVFEPLKDQDLFRRVTVDEEIGTVVWPNGADFCPDVLYEESTPLVRAQENLA